LSSPDCLQRENAGKVGRIAAKQATAIDGTTTPKKISQLACQSLAPRSASSLAMASVIDCN
jgi:hypothetical protein